ncbi:MAG: hypothetical protein WD069_18870 [Planctomycetales bacterium]
MRTHSLCVIAAAAFAAAPLLLTGCGGGASEPRTVTLKSKETSTPPGPEVVNDVGKPGTPEAVPAGGFGGWKGQVVFGGALPQLPPLIKQGDATAKDPAVCAAMAVPNQKLVGEGGGVANVFIYLARPPAGWQRDAAPTEPAVFDQRGCVFLPHALLVRVNQDVRVLSDDPIPHNTHTYPVKSTAFNTVIKAGDREGTTFKYPRAEAEPVSVKCDFHTWMQAYHLPLDHPFAAVSAEDGTFEIQGLPAGTHEFSIWHEGVDGAGGYLERKFKVAIQADQTVEQNIDYPAGRFVADADDGASAVTLSSLIRK